MNRPPLLIFFDCDVSLIERVFVRLSFKDKCDLSLACSSIFKSLLPLVTKNITRHMKDNTDSVRWDIYPYHKVSIYECSSPIINLPLSVTSLLLRNYNLKSPCLDIIAPSLQHLRINNNRGSRVDKIPSSLLSLNFPKYIDFKQPLDKLPSSLTQLYIGDCRYPVNNLPLSLSELTLDTNFLLDSLPSHLCILNVGECSIQESFNNLPPLLTELSLPNNFNKPVDFLPSSLLIINFGDKFNQRVDHLPSITEIIFKEVFYDVCYESNFNQPIDHLPDSLTYLKLSCRFNQSIDYLPSSTSYSLR